MRFIKRNKHPSVLDQGAIPVEGHLVQLLGSLGHQRGGLTKAVYERLWAVADDVPLTIAVTGYQHNLLMVFQELIDRKTIPSRTVLRSYFHDLKAKASASDWPTPTEVPDATAIVASADATREEVGRNGDVMRRAYSNGRYLGLECFDKAGKLLYTDIHMPDKPHVPAYRDRYDGDETPHVRQYLNPEYKVRYQVYYTGSGRAYASHWVSPGGRAYRFSEFTGEESRHFDDLDLARAEWVGGLSIPHERTVFVSDEPATMHALGKSAGGAQDLNIGVIHTVHYLNNWDNTDGFKSWFAKYQDPKSVDRVVVTTDAQATAVRQEVPDELRDKIYVASHAAPKIVSHDRSSDSRFHVVFVGRLDPFKRVDLAIQALHKAQKSEPRLHMTIYGIGPERSRLGELVAELELTETVKFAGYVEGVDRIFANAGVQLFTSLFEGFGLVLTEGYAHGVPAVGFDVPYGPRELIKTGINGELVKSGDVEAMAAALVRSVQSEPYWRKLGAGAKDTAAVLDRSSWVRAWTVAFSKDPVGN